MGAENKEVFVFITGLGEKKNLNFSQEIKSEENKKTVLKIALEEAENAKQREVKK